jgi:hypothetical protein
MIPEKNETQPKKRTLHSQNTTELTSVKEGIIPLYLFPSKTHSQLDEVFISTPVRSIIYLRLKIILNERVIVTITYE